MEEGVDEAGVSFVEDAGGLFRVALTALLLLIVLVSGGLAVEIGED